MAIPPSRPELSTRRRAAYTEGRPNVCRTAPRQFDRRSCMRHRQLAACNTPTGRRRVRCKPLRVMDALTGRSAPQLLGRRPDAFSIARIAHARREAARNPCVHFCLARLGRRCRCREEPAESRRTGEEYYAKNTAASRRSAAAPARHPRRSPESLREGLREESCDKTLQRHSAISIRIIMIADGSLH